ncbi:hypothetical protein [Streptomyces sp. UH6]|uniref:hypothetical protein n=1 Tax=Streptomyces sp. UH6 TaxID=2748379 RepID=UPI0015D4BDC0|nr:hypothetical protein [Streptomyces sp. UH6]NYV74168.1 hypothetical protein [Streptomyces sp. UH6]
MALYGRHVPHPWLPEPTEDLYSLAFKQAAAYGWSFPLSSDQPPPEGQRWAQHEAGGAVPATSAGTGELAWLQAAVLSLPGQSLPIVPMADILLRALGRLGTTVATGLHVLVPLACDAPPPAGPSYGTLLHADVLALADPGAETDVIVTLALPNPDADIDALSAIRQWAPSGSQALLGVVPHAAGASLTPTARSRALGYGLTPTMSCRMRLTEWSLEAAAWLTTHLAESLRHAHVGELALIEVIKECE